MIGRAAGTALAGALEAEQLEGEDELEAARQFVRIAGAAAQQAAAAPPNVNPQTVAIRAVRAAMQQASGGGGAGMAGSIGQAVGAAAGAPSGARTGRWFRRGHKIIIVGV
jgi:hypothetical protein